MTACEPAVGQWQPPAMSLTSGSPEDPPLEIRVEGGSAAYSAVTGPQT